MLLKEFFIKPIKNILEGGNIEIDNPKFDPSQPESSTNPKKIQAQEIQLAPTKISDEVQDRTHMVRVLKTFFNTLNQRFEKTYKTALFNKELLDREIQDFMAGSSKYFFDLLRPNPNFNPSQPESKSNPKMIGISDEEFKKYKPFVGDIDIQCNEIYKQQIFDFLNANINVPIGNATLLGEPSLGNEQYNTLWQLNDPPLKLQIDFEYGRYSPETEKPAEWTAFSHSADWDDIKQGIKGVFHKYLYRALAKANPTEKYIAKLDGLGKARTMKIFGGPDKPVLVTDYNNPPPPIVDQNLSFSVASTGGGGLRSRYKELDPKYTQPPYNFPTTINGIPVLELLKSESSEYEQDLNKQFVNFFGVAPESNDRKLQGSFVGSLELMNKYLDEQGKRNTVNDFLDIVFESGSQMITRDDPQRDYAIKFAAVDKMLEVLGLEDMKNKAEQMAQSYISDYQDLEKFKAKYDKENPNPVTAKGEPKKPQYRKERKDAIAAGTWKELNTPQQLSEQAEPSAPSFTRKGIPHIYAKKPDGTPRTVEMKDLDFLELCKELAANGGTFDNIQINEKIDGAGIRFGKDQNGRPFFMIGGLNQIFYADNVGWFEQNSKGDPERAKSYDQALSIITNSKFIQTLPDDIIVQSEMLFDPEQQENSVDGFNTFVNISYNTKLLGRTMTLVPILVKQYSTGLSVDPQVEKQVIQKLVAASDPNIKIISNNLEQKGINVGNIIKPVLDNYDEYQRILSSRKKSDSEAKLEVQEKLNPIRKEISDTIINSPKIKGLGKLGQFYEGIVINMPGGPVKVTSDEMKTAMEKKMENQFNKSDQTPRVAVVALGSMAGHKGHEQLINFTIDKAKQLKGKAFIYVGSRVGPDDPIPVEMKLDTLHKIFGPNNDKLEISAVQDQTDASGMATKGTHFKKIEKELVKKRPFYNQIYVMVGSDYAAADDPEKAITPDQNKTNEPETKDTGMATQANTLQGRLSKFSPLNHVKIQLVITPRDENEGGTGKSTSALRDALTKESNGTINSDQAFNIWRSSFSNKIDDNRLKALMVAARKNMQLPEPEIQTQTPDKPKSAPVGQNTSTIAAVPQTAPIQERLFNALVRPKKNIRQGVAEGIRSNYQAALYIDEFGDGDHWYVKGAPDTIKRFVQLANSLEDEAVKGTEYEPGVGAMAKIHKQLGNDQPPQWKIVSAQNLEQLQPIDNKTLAALSRADLSNGAQEFMTDLLWNLESNGQAVVHGDSQQGVAEGGFSSRTTQATVVTPAIVRAAKSKIDNYFISDLNQWLRSKGMIENGEEVKPGKITGSGAHHGTDPQDTIYGDIDMQIVVPDLYKGELHTTGERQYRWKKIVLDFIKETNPEYLDSQASLDAELPVVKLDNETFIQVDLMPHPQKYSQWGKYRATAEQGITGLLNGNLFAVLSELLTVNLQHSGVQYKTAKTGGLRQKFDSLKKGQYDLGEISYDVETFVLDILKDEHQAFGQGELEIDPLLERYPGVQTVDNIEDLRIQPLVNAIKGLARSFELNDLYGKGNLSKFSSAEDFIQKFKKLYALKANYAATNKKFDKAETPELKAHVQRKQEKIHNGLEYVMMLFDTGTNAPKYLDWLKTKDKSTTENDDMSGGYVKHKSGLGFQTYPMQGHNKEFEEEMLPKKAFAGTGAPHFHKLGTAAQAKGKQKGPVKRGQLVGYESANLVPLDKNIEQIMEHFVRTIIINEAIRYKK